MQVDIRGKGSIPGWGRSPGGGHGNPLQYSCLENPMDRGDGGLQSMGSQRVRHDWVIEHTCTPCTILATHCRYLKALISARVSPPRIHISVQIPHQDGMLPLISTMPLHNLHFLLSESIYRHQHVCSNLVTTRDLRGVSGKGRDFPVSVASPARWPLGMWLSELCLSCFLVLKICTGSGFAHQQAAKQAAWTVTWTGKNKDLGIKLTGSYP